MAEPRRASASPEEPVGGARFLIVEARYYDAIGAMLFEGACAALAAAGAQHDVVRVPGALEIPGAVAIATDAAAAAGKPYAGALALGCVIRGETYHFEIVAGESSRALMDLSVDRKLAIGNGILTVENEEQASVRADPRQGDKGGDAARAALALYRLARGVAEMARGENRSTARLAAVQALYQMDVAGTGVAQSLAEFEAHWIGREVEGETYKPAEVAFFRGIVEGVLEHQGAIDREIDSTLADGWPLARVEAVMRAILRAGDFELRFRADIPARVVISEYVDVAGAFFEREEAGMTNAVLDALARQRRPTEFTAR